MFKVTFLIEYCERKNDTIVEFHFANRNGDSGCATLQLPRRLIEYLPW